MVETQNTAAYANQTKISTTKGYDEAELLKKSKHDPAIQIGVIAKAVKHLQDLRRAIYGEEIEDKDVDILE